MSLNEIERGLSAGEQRADIHTSPTMPAGAVAIEMSTDHSSQAARVDGVKSHTRGALVNPNPG